MLKKFPPLAARGIFVGQFFTIFNSYFCTKSEIFFQKSMGSPKIKLDSHFLHNTKQKFISKKFCFPGCQSYFWQSFFHHFWLKITILEQNQLYFISRIWGVKKLLQVLTSSCYYTKQKKHIKIFMLWLPELFLSAHFSHFFLIKNTIF
jgi:hypothetical protein